MSATKDQLQKIARPLAVKWATRGAVWLLTAKLGYDAAVADGEAAMLGNACGAVACVLVGMVIDWWHHRKDKAEIPESK